MNQPQLLTVQPIRPHISRAQSIQSSTATGEYFADYASENSSHHSDNSKASYETPPSRPSTPIVQLPSFESDMTQPRDRTSCLASFDDMSPPTPHNDDTQYIRFAIDQLTRDEDVLGRGRDSSLSRRSPPTQAMPTTPAPAVLPYPVPTTARSSQPPTLHHASNIPRVPQSPQPRPIITARNSAPDETMVAVNPPDGQSWADFGFKPRPLRPYWLGLYLFACLLILAGLIFSNVYSSRSGLYDYDGYTTATYFVFQYLPQLLGMIIILWRLVIEAAVYRSAPYFSMSNARSQDRILQDFRTTPANFLLPDLRWFRIREPLMGSCFLIFWLSNISIPLLSCFYQTQWVTNDGAARWRWTTVQTVGWSLVAVYALLSVAIAYCIVRFWRAKSALIWDPVSLADLIVLFSRSNVAQYFERTEVVEHVRPHIPSMSLMLGYWTTSRRPDIFYAVGGDNALVKRISIEGGHMQEKEPGSQDSSFDVERHRYSYDSAFTRSIHSPFTRYRHISWYLRDISIIVWTIVALGLLVAFLVVSFVNRAVQDGFEPLLPSITSLDGFSSSNFLYSFLPALIGMIMFMLWQPIDVFFRTVQPFANLSSPTGASAERSLLLSYQAGLPLWVTIGALLNGDYKVALTSLVTIVSALIPALAGGVFTAQLHADGDVRMIASMPGYISLCVFVAIYALSFSILWPKRKRYLPHGIDTIAEQLSFLYASPLMSELWNIRTKADLVGRLVGAPAGLTGDWREKRPKGRYAFGVFTGRDGKDHLGIDRLSRPGSGEMLVTTGMSR